MATKNSTLLNKRVYQGEDGNVSKEGFSYTLASAQIGDVINGLKFPAGTKATGVEYINAALGTGVTLDVKLGSTTLVSGLSCSAAGKGYIPVADVLTADNALFSLVVGGGEVCVRDGCRRGDQGLVSGGLGRQDVLGPIEG